MAYQFQFGPSMYGPAGMPDTWPTTREGLENWTYKYKPDDPNIMHLDSSRFPVQQGDWGYGKPGGYNQLAYDPKTRTYGIISGWQQPDTGGLADFLGPASLLAGPFGGISGLFGQATDALGASNFLNTLNPFTSSGGQFGDLLGGTFEGDPIGAMGYTAAANDPIEALWRATEATGSPTASGAASAMGFSGADPMLNLMDPSWADSSLLAQSKQAYDQYGKPAKQAYDLIKMFQEPVLKGGQQQTTSAGASSSGAGGTQGFSFLPQAGQTTALPGTSDVAGTKGPGQAVYTGPGAPPVSNTGDTRSALGLLGVDTY